MNEKTENELTLKVRIFFVITAIASIWLIINSLFFLLNCFWLSRATDFAFFKALFDRSGIIQGQILTTLFPLFILYQIYGKNSVKKPLLIAIAVFGFLRIILFIRGWLSIPRILKYLSRLAVDEMRMQYYFSILHEVLGAFLLICIIIYCLSILLDFMKNKKVILIASLIFIVLDFLVIVFNFFNSYNLSMFNLIPIFDCIAYFNVFLYLFDKNDRFNVLDKETNSDIKI